MEIIARLRADGPAPAAHIRAHDPALDPRSLPGSRRQRCRPGLAAFARPRAAGDGLGYRRFWMAEHHNMRASPARRRRWRWRMPRKARGASASVPAASCCPTTRRWWWPSSSARWRRCIGAVDLGLGRAPGTDQIAARALRRNLAGDIDDFPATWRSDGIFPPTGPGQRCAPCRARGRRWRCGCWGPAPSGRSSPPISAALCLRLAFRAGADDGGDHAVSRPLPASARLAAPHVMIGRTCSSRRRRRRRGCCFLGAAGLREPAQRAAGQAAGAGGRLRGGAGRRARTILDHALSCSVVGAPAQVRQGIEALAARTGADERWHGADPRSGGAAALLRAAGGRDGDGGGLTRAAARRG